MKDVTRGEVDGRTNGHMYFLVTTEGSRGWSLSIGASKVLFLYDILLLNCLHTTVGLAMTAGFYPRPLVIS